MASQSWQRLCSRIAVGTVFAAACCSAPAQIIQGLQPKSAIAAYATLPVNVTPDFGYYGPVLTGYSLGGYLQTPYYVGVEVRGSIQRRMNAQHQESALIGPRFAMRFGRVTPYSSFLIGEGNGWRFQNPPVDGQKRVKPVEGMGTQWTWTGGVDIKLSHRLAVRAGEVSYSRLYLKNWTLAPVNVTAGVVLRLK
jgi:hypothetical protein